ncbi:MAG: fused MFS/spermidine synthase [Desulfobacterales bacterium]|nr:fused MFS/spermidine synthase [Desulfobacterales bacterium]
MRRRRHDPRDRGVARSLPYLGASVVVWTSLIGIILGSLSLGYWWGGRLADRKASCRTLSAIIMTAAVSVGILPVAKSAIFGLLEGRITNIYVGSTVASVFLFTMPSVLLGMVSPYAVKLKMKDLRHSGATVGTLYAISTVGSIAGTFLAGFALIAYFGTTNLLLALAIVLGLTSLLASYRDMTVTKSVVVLLLGVLRVPLQFLRPVPEEAGDYRSGHGVQPGAHLCDGAGYHGKTGTAHGDESSRGAVGHVS